MRRFPTRVAVLAAAFVAVSTALAGSAAADPPNSSVGGSNGPQGPIASARITFSGPAAPGGGGTRTVRVPATCWWEPISANISLGRPPVDASDPESVKEWVRSVMPFLRGHAAAGSLTVPTGAMLDDAIRRVAAGEALTWYQAKCVPGKDALSTGLVQQTSTYMGIPMGIMYQAFPTGNPPDPVVAAETLAIEARDVMVIEDPAIARNPVVPGVGGGTLVRLPTWFWVTNPVPALGGAAGQRVITATAGAAQATVTAATDGLRIDSPAGGTSCPPVRAAAAYTAGAPDAGACTVAFRRASVGYGGGFPVTASTAWQVAWEGVEADGTGAAGALAPLARASVVPVPVAESQAVVSAVR